MKKRRGVNKAAEEKANPKPIQAKTEGQKDYIRSVVENDVVFATGPAGTGKTAVAIGMACEAMKRGLVEKIVITRPCIEANGKNTNSFGALPGELEEKIYPYLIPALEELEKFLGVTLYNQYKWEKKIHVAPLEFMRGRNFHNAFMILDEAQNCTYEQLKMFLTRMGMDTKVCINGDVQQTDLRMPMQGNFKTALELMINQLDGVQGIGLVTLTETDIVRNPMIARILRALTWVITSVLKKPGNI